MQLLPSETAGLSIIETYMHLKLLLILLLVTIHGPTNNDFIFYVWRVLEFLYVI